MEPKPKSDNWIEKNDVFFSGISDRLASGANYILVGDSHIARIFKDMMKERIWEKYFGPHHISFANGGDKIENTMWMVNKYNLPGGCDVAIVHIGGNNIKNGCDPREIANGIMKVVKRLHQNNQDTLVLLTGIMPGKGKSFGIVRKLNNILDDRTPYSKNLNIFYKKPDFHDWINGKNHLKEELDYGDGLHYTSVSLNKIFHLLSPHEYIMNQHFSSKHKINSVLKTS